MATVYLAEDLKHHRKVAIKVLEPALAQLLGPARFLQEIEIAARLNHPHILPLHDSGDANGILYYVMPYVEGESLRERLAREGELPVPTATRILREIVDALAAAHRHGVIHRDIKPDNVMLFENHALVTDFGIAKALTDATGRQTLTTAGVALGTPVYMAPEQAVGDSHMDHRADIYAAGVVGYEMLTGRPPFSGGTPREVLAAHVTEDPTPVTHWRASVPVALAGAVMRCLAKKPADRWQSAEELLHELEELSTPTGTTPLPKPSAPAKRRRRVAVAAGAVVGAIVVIGGALLLLHRAPPTFVVGRSVQVTSQAGMEIHPALSPDGKFVAYAAGGATHTRIYIRTVNGGRTIPLTDDTTEVEFAPQWSPDGSQLLYLAPRGVWIASALGGAGRLVVGASATAAVAGATWSPDGTSIAFVRGDSVLVRSIGGGAARLVGTLRAGHACRWSPRGRWIACVSGNLNSVTPGPTFGNLSPSAIALFPAAGGDSISITGLTSLNESPVWSPDGRRLFFVSDRDGPRDVYVQEVGSNGRPNGAAVRVTTGLNAQSLSLSADGSLFAYDVYSAHANIWTLPIPSDGPVNADRATQLTTGNQLIESMSPSFDDKWLLYDSDLRGDANIFRIPIGGGTPEQLTSDPFDEFAPSLSPDGRLLAYHSFRTGSRDVEVKPLDGGPVEQVTSSPEQESYPVWAPDGRRLLIFDQILPSTITLVTRLGVNRWSAPDTIVRGLPATGEGPRWSPDGSEIACVAGDSSVPLPERALYILSLASRKMRTVAMLPSRAGLSWAPDGRLYVKTHDPDGHSYIWQVVEGKPLRLLVRFPDLNRPSNRDDFAADRTRFYFTFEDRESDIYVANVTQR